MANQRHVELLKSSVTEWNKWREENPEETPELSGADLSGANVSFANLTGVRLPFMKLRGAILYGAKLNGAILNDADFTGANLQQVDFQKADLSGAKLDGADLTGANLGRADLKRARLNSARLVGAALRNANLSRADLGGAKLGDADLSEANLRDTSLRKANLIAANLQDADLRGAKNLVLNGTYVRGARFQARAKDPWSVLRRLYSGPRLIFNLLFLIAFLVPYAVKVLFWVSVNRAQTSTEAIVGPGASELGLDAGSVTNFARCFAEQCDQLPVWKVILGLDRGWLFSAVPIALITYNGLKILLTWRVSPLREEEERSGYSPRWTGYRDLPATQIRDLLPPSWIPTRLTRSIPDTCWTTYWALVVFLRGYRLLFWAHQYFVRWVFVIAVCAFAYNAPHWLDWLWMPVWIPG